jgi:hypothetical protein
MVLVGGASTVAGLVLAVAGRGAERVTGAIAALFFFACLLAVLAGGPGAPPWPARVVGGVGAAFFGLGLVALLRRGWGRRWRVVLTPSAVVVAAGGARTVVPWEAIRQVRLTEVTTHVRGVAAGEPLVGIDVHDLRAVRTGRLGRLLLPLNRRLAADVALPVRTLAVEPARLCQVLRHYQEHPEDRGELAGAGGLARLGG